MWYVVRTETGREEQIVEEIRALLPQDKYKECFSMKRENLCHSRGELKVIVERMFPGYVFLVTDAPAYFYDELKRIPRYAKVLGREEDEFFSIKEEEQDFLQSLMDEEKGSHLVRLSPVITNKNGDFLKVGGALRQYRKNIVKKRNRLRYVLVKMELFGKEREIYLGIRMEGDLGESREEFLAGFKAELQAGMADGTDETAEGNGETEKRLAEQGICEGAVVCVTEGCFAGSFGVVTKINPAKKVIAVEMELFHEKRQIQLDWRTGMETVGDV